MGWLHLYFYTIVSVKMIVDVYVFMMKTIYVYANRTIILPNVSVMTLNLIIVRNVYRMENVCEVI
jgi:hypothetical protein